MTENNSLKKLIRARMALLDENYTLARANLYLGKAQTLEALFPPAELARLKALRDGLILVVGPSGSGKTTTAASLIHNYDELAGNAPQSSRVIILENDVELEPILEKMTGDKTSVVSLSPKEDESSGKTTLSELITAAVRMRPDVIAVGEIRSWEVIMAYTQAMNTGHAGIGTLHSTGLRQTLRKLEAFASHATLYDQLLSGLSAVMEQVRIPVGRDSVVLTAVIPVTNELSKLAAANASDEEYESYLQSQGIESLNAKLARLEKTGIIARTGGDFRFNQ